MLGSDVVTNANNLAH